MIDTSIKYLNKMKTKNGLFIASKPEVSTGYNRIWIRDNLYISIAFDAVKDSKTIEKMFHGLFRIFKKYEWKIDDAIKQKPVEDYKFIHPLYTEGLDEIDGGWGWKQNDAIGGFLFFAAKFNSNNYNTIKTKCDYQILQKLVLYLESIEYWKDEDNGMWEENKEIHASSVGACVAGLKEVSKYVHVPKKLITDGEKALNKLLPNESITKEVDLSLLSLIYPYNIVDKETKIKILSNIEEKLERRNGIIRYSKDAYYNQNAIEASWTMGFPWMAICYYEMNDNQKYREYLVKALQSSTSSMEMPELYKEDKLPNENTPLGWSQSMLVRALTL